ncbi:MAG: type II secretion system protein N [Rhodoferax sp.]|nr:type II secretion system protein N [Rhodoferax sp.]
MPRRPTPHAAPASPPWGWAFAGMALGLVAALVVFAPARWLTNGLAAATQGQVQLQQAQGTVWDGNAQLVLGADPAAATALPGRVQWVLRPTGLGLALQLSAPCCLQQPWTWRMGWSDEGLRVVAGDLQANQALRLPSGLLAGLGTPWNTLALQGDMALQTQGLSAHWQSGRLAVRGQSQLDATGMSTRLTPLSLVGSYRLDFQGGDTPRITLQTLDGALQLQGQGQWVAGRLQFTGEASAAPGREGALANLLNIIGRRDGARSLIQVG